MKQDKNYITKEKYAEFEKELAELKGPRREEILKSLAFAKSLGDLKENAEYHQARENQGVLETRIQKIENILRSAEIVQGGGGDIIEIGSKVVVQKEGTSVNKNYIIVGSEEANMAEGKISNRSPFGEALFGKKKGDKISFSTPNGVVDYKIIDVS
jgi:transcription elongation factor GreA